MHPLAGVIVGTCPDFLNRSKLRGVVIHTVGARGRVGDAQIVIPMEYFEQVARALLRAGVGPLAQMALDAEAVEAAQPKYAHTPDKCPSSHWNGGDDICADCGTELG